MNVGFTGTSKGMLPDQRAAVRSTLQTLLGFVAVKKAPLDCSFHHGDCIGADAEAHHIAKAIGYKVVIHPPSNPSARAFCSNDGFVDILHAKPYLVRNHDIVDASDVLVAAPKRMNEELRSGTWATVRYAAKQHKKIFIVWPNGIVSGYNEGAIG